MTHAAGIPVSYEDIVVSAVLNHDFERLVEHTELVGANIYSIKVPDILFLLKLYSLTMLHVASYADSLESFVYYHARGVSLTDTTPEGYLPLHYACARGSLEIVSYILKNDPDQARKTYVFSFF